MLRTEAQSRRRGRPQPTGSHYDVLEIGPSADALQIRAAYVRLLKNSHPDRAAFAANSRSVEVERLVTAYKILKDDRLRAAYDEQLLGNFGGRAQWRSAPTARKRRRNQRDPSRATILISMLVLAALALAMLTNSWPSSNSSLHFARGLRAGTHEEVPDPASLEPIARLASRLPVQDAAAFSKRCFGKSQRSDSPSAADACIAFDTAFIYWQQGVGGTYLGEPYFQPQAEAARTENALERLNPDAAMVRAASIRASTFEALLKLVDSNSSSLVQEQDRLGPPDDKADQLEKTDLNLSQFDTPSR